MKVGGSPETMAAVIHWAELHTQLRPQEPGKGGECLLSSGSVDSRALYNNSVPLGHWCDFPHLVYPRSNFKNYRHVRMKLYHAKDKIQIYDYYIKPYFVLRLYYFILLIRI